MSSSLQLPACSTPSGQGAVVLCILDGVGIGRRDEGDAVHLAHTPNLDQLLSAAEVSGQLAAHGRAVGLPSDKDMGNSEVGHNALGAGRIFQQGASLINAALASGAAFGESWDWVTREGTLHLLGLFSDGNVHSHIDHLDALLERARQDSISRVRLHLLTDGRDVEPRSALRYLSSLEARLSALQEQGMDVAIASGGGRMGITMDRYEADWDMVERGWRCHALGEGRRFSSMREAIETLYAEDPELDDQHLPPFVIQTPDGEPAGAMRSGDGVVLFNFRGDRALEISRCLEGRPVPFERDPALKLRFAGIMQYDGDEQLPARYLVPPPQIDRTVGDYLVAAGRQTYALSETQKYGHVTYFFNGNRSGLLDAQREEYLEIPSDSLPLEQHPNMKASEITDATVAALRSRRFDHIRLNLANGDMVGHTGDLSATVEAMEHLDACLGQILEAAAEVGAVVLVTADHGNADQMFELDKAGSPRLDEQGRPVPRTAHSLNPVPYALFDPSGCWRGRPQAGERPPSLAHVSATLLQLCGLQPPEDYLPSLLLPL